MKITFTTHDIFALVLEMQSYIGYRVNNVYDINNKTICIKFNDHESLKKYLLIESSSKFYMLNNFSAVNDFPSSFSSKLRKHINNKRIESIKQLNLDRVIDIQFSSGELAYHLICEFYASGNIILTDNSYNILTLIHPHTYEKSSDKEKEVKVSVGKVYPVTYATNQIDLSFDSFKSIIQNGFEKVNKKINIKQFIVKTQLVLYSPNILEHCLLVNDINPNKKIDQNDNIFEIFNDEILCKLIECIKNMFSYKIKFSGYFNESNFLPYMYQQFLKDKFESTETFTEAVTKYFTTLQPIQTKEEIKLKEKALKLSKEEKVLYNINKQIENFDNKISIIDNKIENISLNIELIQNFLKNVFSFDIHSQGNSSLSKKDDNITFTEYISHKNIVNFKYNDYEYSFNPQFSVYENINNLYKDRKIILDKRSKADEVLEKNKLNQLKKLNKINQIKNNSETHLYNKIEIKGQTKDNWFEQFNWFITSDKFLVISGKTAEQNEHIVKKYMENNDIYIHSDVFGSGSCIIKTKSIQEFPEIYPKSVIEACENLICHTKAWKLGVPDKAYWVYSSQVSKTTESGEYISKGSFIIRGQKNYINVDKMELGFGILFKINGKDDFEVNGESNVEYGLPIMGPYSSMNKYKFKVKVIPGNQKIKKILQTVISTFYKKGNMKEKDAIKKISNDSIQRVLVSGVKFFV
jgi:predicted ribosome quality control (RQC) complex YloA/Tae2 family protein